MIIYKKVFYSIFYYLSNFNFHKILSNNNNKSLEHTKYSP